MRIAYIDHSFHKETKSTTFLVNLLRKAADVDVLWDDAWRGGAPVNPEVTGRAYYDCIVIFQAEQTMCNFAAAGLSENVVFVPMFDSSGSLGKSFWQQEIGSARVLCFCRRQYEELARWGVEAFHVRYFPDPAGYSRGDVSGLKGVFWWRREVPSWSTIRSLTRERPLQNLHVHAAPDPGYSIAEGALEDAPFPVTQSRWTSDGREYREALKDGSVYFAPRIAEGIGQSFLEAMASGMVVVSPDRPTMNEYLTDGVTGYLYDPENPRPIDFESWENLGKRARQAVESGFQEWEREEGSLLSWILGTDVAKASVPGVGSFIPVDFLVHGGGKSLNESRASLDLEQHGNWRMISSPEDIRPDAWVLQMNAGDRLCSAVVLEEILVQAPQNARMVICHYLRRSAGVEEWWRTSDPARIVARAGKEVTDSQILRRWPLRRATLFSPGVFQSGEECDFTRAHHADRFLVMLPEEGPGPILQELRFTSARLIREGASSTAMQGMLANEVREVCATYYSAGWRVSLRWLCSDPAILAFLWAGLWKPVRFYGVRGGLQLLADFLRNRIFMAGRVSWNFRKK